MTALPALALFDIDGTLFDSERVWAEALALAMEELGERQRPERLMALIYGMAWPDAWRTLRDAFPEALGGLSAFALGQMMVKRFDTLFAPDAPKGEVIVTFVALLELLRLRHVTVTQTAPFGELWVDAIPEGIPDAHLPLPAFDEDA